MPAVLRRLTRRRAAVLIVVALVVVSAVVAARRASAWTPDQRYADAIMAEAVATGAFTAGRPNPAMRVVQDVTGTADRRGAFVLYDINARSGVHREAIYAFNFTSAASRALARVSGESVPAGSVRAKTLSYLVYQSWLAGGAERSYGYPITSVHGATPADIAAGCRAGDLVQHFHRVSLFGETRAACVAGPHPPITDPVPLPTPVVRWVRA